MKKKTLLLILSPLILGLLAVGYSALRMPEPAPLLLVPSPNGYDDLVAAGKMLQEAVENREFAELSMRFEKSFLGARADEDDDEADESPTMTPEELKAIVAAGESALELARRGLGRECVLPVDYGLDPIDFESVAGLRRLCHLLVMQGMTAELDGKHGEAARHYLDCARVGYKSRRGGLFIHSMIGHGLAWWGGLSNLLAIRDRLAAGDLETCLAALAALQREEEPVDDVFARERTFVYESTPFLERLTLTLYVKRLRSQMQLFDGQERALRDLTYLMLALELHERRTGSLPERLSELSVPGRDQVPRDPFSDGDFVYRKKAEGYELYSLGPDGDDDRGRVLPILTALDVAFGEPPDTDGDIVATEAGRTR